MTSLRLTDEAGRCVCATCRRGDRYVRSIVWANSIVFDECLECWPRVPHRYEGPTLYRDQLNDPAEVALRKGLPSGTCDGCGGTASVRRVSKIGTREARIGTLCMTCQPRGRPRDPADPPRDGLGVHDDLDLDDSREGEPRGSP